jgi:hypothetical protein
MKIHYMPQYSPEWYEARRGIPTASAFDRIITAKTQKPAAGAESYINELIADSIRLDPTCFTERPMSSAMKHGTDCEPEARRFYEMDRGATVQLVGFCLNDEDTAGCSPDFLVGEDGVGELKCPQPKQHVEYLRAGVLPDEYRAQCHGHLIVTGRAYCDFLAYCPAFPPLLVRVVPDDFTEKLRGILKEFCDRYAAAKAQVMAML